MRKVFVVNEPKGNRLALGKFGEVVQLCPGWIDNKDLPEALSLLVSRLEQEFQDGDYVVLGGHAKMNMVVFHWVLTKNKVLRQLMPNRERWFVLMHDARENTDGTAREWWKPV